MTETDEAIAGLGFEQHNKIKLIYHTKGNYTWELSLLSLDIDELEKTNNKMIERFGNAKE